MMKHVFVVSKCSFGGGYEPIIKAFLDRDRAFDLAAHLNDNRDTTEFYYDVTETELDDEE